MSELAISAEFQKFVDPTAESAVVEDRGDGTFLLTTRGEDGGQVLLRRNGSDLEIVESDNVIDFGPTIAAAARCAGAGTKDQHDVVAQAIMDQVDKFSSATGPDHGNLACVWAVRHVVRDALGYWVTRDNGTATFGAQLATCFREEFDESLILPGGIIISPTEGANIGHVGILGAGHGDGRLIYSNSSKAAVWKQNHSIGSWRNRYVKTKRLEMKFYPLPRFE